MRALAMLVLAACADPRGLSGPCAGTDCTVHVHPDGFVDPQSNAFHGKYLQAHDWDFTICQKCHGADFTGGAAGVSCLSCHADGPTACTTCHGTGPTSNAHRAHAGASVTCAECHKVPQSWDADGHILHDGVAITTPPQIVFGARANLTIDPADRTGPPTWDGTSCSNVYCHGAALHDAGGVASAPRWDDPTPPGSCNRCHGAPPPSHAQDQCATCHPAGAPHIDGIVQVGRVPGCSGCHGSAASPAPPTDLSGNTFTTALGVGAHQRHLNSPISAPIACSACHLVPTAIDSPGHIDTPPPAEVNVVLGWDRNAQTCTAWCHGNAQPRWTSTGEASCGTCHGIPPGDAAHSPSMTLASCATCHPKTVDPFGNIIITNNESTHINGVVDLQ